MDIAQLVRYHRRRIHYVARSCQVEVYLSEEQWARETPKYRLFNEVAIAVISQSSFAVIHQMLVLSP